MLNEKKSAAYKNLVEKMLMAYELYQTGETKSLELNAYSHGTKGINEYAKDKKRYKGK